MSQVKRWNVESDEQDGHCSLWNVESAEGEFVKYEDYAELKAQRDALAAENEQLRNINSLCAELAGGLLSEEDAASFAAQFRAGEQS